MKKLLFLLAFCVSIPMLAISGVGYPAQAKAEGLYNAREELEYTPYARMERLEEQRREIQFQHYQQQQYLQHERLMDQQNMYNQSHQKPSELSEVLLMERQ